MITLTLDPDGQTVTLRLTEYLGGERFNAYRQTCLDHGGRYVPAQKATRCPVEAVPGLLRAFAAAGLAVTLDPRISEHLQAEAQEATSLLDAGRARLQAANAQLASRGLALYPYQRTGVEWLAPRRRALLSDEMGLGKSAQALLSLPDQAAALVVAPAAVARFWASESARWRPDLSVSRVPSREAWSWPQTGEVRICTYGLLPGDDEVPVPPAGAVVIADEAHLCKAPKALRTKCFRAVAKTALDNDGRVWLLTGTPLLNRPPELWAVLGAAGLEKDAFGGWSRFVSMFHGSRGRFGYEWGRASEEVPDLLRKVALRRHRKDVLPDLPTKTHRHLAVNGLDAATITLCDEVLAVLQGQGIDLAAVTAQVEASKVHGVVFELMSRARAALATAKLPALLELVETYEEEEEPVVVFSAHRVPVEALGAREGWGLITGSTSADERGRLVEAFQAGQLKGLAGTIAAMGVGVTLTRAHQAILVDLAWTPALNSQAEDRICRIGQDRGVIITRLVADHPLDERVTELLAAKQAVIEASVEASAVQADYVGTSPAAELAAAANEARRLSEEAAVTAAISQAEAKERKAREQAAVQGRLNGSHDGREIDVSGKFRGPCNPREDAIRRAIIGLAQLDPDYAAQVNGVGFSRFDGEFGHSLAEALVRHGRLSDKQWEMAEKLTVRYRRQVGDLPEVEA